MVQRSMYNDIIKDNTSQNKRRTYRTLKSYHTQEKYLTFINDTRLKIRGDVTKMRLSDHRHS